MTKEFVAEVVVPNVDGVVVPTTAPASCAKTAAVICCRGERVSKLLLSEDTRTCKYSVLLFEKSRLSGTGYPFAVSPMLTVKTPCLTVALTEVGSAAVLQLCTGIDGRVIPNRKFEIIGRATTATE